MVTSLKEIQLQEILEGLFFLPELSSLTLLPSHQDMRVAASDEANAIFASSLPFPITDIRME
jgi:hypothetical protein